MSRTKLVGIETGGTKLQIAVADRQRPQEITASYRTTIQRKSGAPAILDQLEQAMFELDVANQVVAIGFGFGGPVDVKQGRAIISHQVAGWQDFPLRQWCQQRWPVPVAVGNDCNVAALAEARIGAGKGVGRLLYCTVGTGVGGGMVIDGRIDGEQRPAAAEIGHLRPGFDAVDCQHTVESLASGLGLERSAAAILADPGARGFEHNAASDLAAGKSHVHLTARDLAMAAGNGNPIAIHLFQRAAQALGWGLAQATTLLAPERIVIGGGVASSGPEFIEAIRRAWRTYCFPPLESVCELVPSQLGDRVVLHGALQIASQTQART